MSMRTAIIIPVYNHGEQVGEVIRQSLELGLPVFVVDDGSTDSTTNTGRPRVRDCLITSPTCSP